MSDVAVNLQALIEFHSHLKSFNKELAGEFGRMRSHWRSLDDVWHDQKHDQFGEALDDIAQGIERYLETTEKHEAYLAKLIEGIIRAIELRLPA